MSASSKKTHGKLNKNNKNKNKNNNNKKLKGGQETNSSEYEQIYTNFLSKFGANTNNTANQIQKKVANKLSADMGILPPGTPGPSISPEKQIGVIQNTLTDYINAIVAIQQAFQRDKSTFQIQQSNFQMKKNVDMKYSDLIKKTNALIRNFDKYLLKDMSFIRMNPKKDALLNDLSQRMKKIVDEYKLELSSNVGAENYTQNTNQKTQDLKNKIMISVIQNLLENVRPIYRDLRNNAQPLKTNTTRNSTKQILANIEKERTMGTQLTKEFSENIGNWIKLLTEIIELNAVTIIFPSKINSPNATKKLGDIHLEYQEAQKNINNLLSDVVSQNTPKNFFHPKFTNEVFAQELVGEIFRWGMATFKIYKYNQFLGQTPSTQTPSAQTPPAQKLKQN